MGAYFKMVLIAGLLACGSSAVPIDAGVDSGADVGDATDDVADVVTQQGCVVDTCDGSIICPANTACPIGDGCNQCLCKKDDGGYHSLCSGNQCDCANPPDY